MSEQESERWALIPYAANSPARVQVAGKQLSIAAHLKEDIERGQLVAILKRISAWDSVCFMSNTQSLDGDLIDRFGDRWDWQYGLSMLNRSLPWSLELIARFLDRWDWRSLSRNKFLPWTPDLIEYFSDRWDWAQLSGNTSLPWSKEIIERNKDLLDWKQLSSNGNLPWSEELIKLYVDSWDWGCLSRNEALPWSLDLIERYLDLWDWGGGGAKVMAIASNKAMREGRTREVVDILRRRVEMIGRLDISDTSGLSCNRSLPWSLELIKRYEDRWDWWWLSTNEEIPWSSDLIDRYIDRWDWGGNLQVRRDWGDPLDHRTRARNELHRDGWDMGGLAKNKSLPWSHELIDRYKDRWDWGMLSKNDALPWSVELIERYGDRWNWKFLSSNRSLPWSLELLNDYEVRWNWGAPYTKENRGTYTGLSGNVSLPWSVDLIERYKDRWNWKWLSQQRGGPIWSLEILEHFEDRWEWGELSRCMSLPCSINPIERFKDRWSWPSLSKNGTLKTPALRPADIFEIMVHHFSGEALRKGKSKTKSKKKNTSAATPTTLRKDEPLLGPPRSPPGLW